MNLETPQQLQNYIDGHFESPASGLYLDNVNPATGRVYCQVPNSNALDVELAVDAAGKALPEWKNTSLNERFRLLNKIADLIEENNEALALAETTDNGKPLWLSQLVDIRRAAENFRFFATAIMHFSNESHSMPGLALNYTLRQPVGIVGCISPWNLPLYLFSWKVAPALAAGNCVVAKPSEVTPLTGYLLAKIVQEAGLPKGVLNIVHGSGPDCGAAIVRHPEIKAISFTGSTRAGKEIASVAAPMFKKISLELGGKNPNVIFADCNWEHMMKTTVQSSFSNQGEICLCGSRILVEESIYERFKKELIEKARQLTVGDPLEAGSKMGAMVSRQHFEKVMGCIELAKQEGGTILYGGQAVHPEGRCAQGYFIEPTIIEGLGPNCRTNMEEIFGPVVSLQSFKTDEEALQLANCSHYGLSATIWTENLNRAHRMAAAVESGIIWVNCWLLRDLRTPFGGMKQSGVGREGGMHALEFVTEPKNVCIKW